MIGLALAAGAAALGSATASTCSWRGSSNCGTDDNYVALPSYGYDAPAPNYGYGQTPFYAFVPPPTYGYRSLVAVYGYGPAQPWSFGYAASPMCGSGRYPSHEFRSPAYGYGDVGAWGARYVGLA